MMPAAFVTYFATIAGTGAALVGLLFVAISIAPEQTVYREAPLERQAMATSCFIALSNPFVIALMALIPSLGIDAVGVTTFAVSAMGLLNALILGRFLLRQSSDWRNMLRRAGFVLVSLALYGCEFYVGTLLIHAATAVAALTWLALLLVGLNILGLSRAWDLLGAHRYRFQDLLKSQPAADAERGMEEQRGAHTATSRK